MRKLSSVKTTVVNDADHSYAASEDQKQLLVTVGENRVPSLTNDFGQVERSILI